MDGLDLYTRFRDRHQARQQVAALLVGNQWDTMDDLEEWATIGPRIAKVAIAAQYATARDAAAFGAAWVGVENIYRAEAIAGYTTHGYPVGRVLNTSAANLNHKALPATEALAQGRARILAIVATAIADAKRDALSVVTATTTTEWVRVANFPCCQRCYVLHGKRYKFNSGFQRHPNCDCEHIPHVKHVGWLTDYPEDELDAVTDLTSSQRQAIDDGADLWDVIQGGVPRGAPSMRAAHATGARPTLKAIYAASDGDRERATEYLRQFGYIR